MIAQHLFTAQEFAALNIDGRVELVNGIICDMSPVGPEHNYAVNVLMNALRPLADEFFIQSAAPVAVSGWRGSDSPYPDIAVVKQVYGIPTGDDALVLIEVSDSSYNYDRSVKMPIYVAAGIDSLIVNIAKRQVELYNALPHPRVYSEGETFMVADVQIAVSSLFNRNAAVSEVSE